MLTPEQFRLKYEVCPDTGCWLWKGFLNRGGYGLCAVYGRVPYRTTAHRISWEVHRGAIPEGYVVDHLCRVRHCVNPDHLEPVTQKVNIHRGDTGLHERRKTHCPHGHEYTEENTYIKTLATGTTSRECRTCNRIKSREYARRKRAEARR